LRTATGPGRSHRYAPQPLVSLSVQLGLLLSLATALASVLGFLYKHRGAQLAPAVDWRRPLHSTFALFRSGWYTIGILVALGGWFFHVGALALAPITLVQSVIAGGLVFLTVLADKLFGQRVSRREWIGVALMAAGLAFLAATMEGAGDEAHSDYATGTLLLFVGALSLAGTLAAVAGGWREAAEDGEEARDAGAPSGAARDAERAAPRLQARRASIYALSAGLLWAASDTSIKALSAHLDDDGLLLTVAHPLSLVILIASLAGLLVSAKSLQLGDAVPVIAVTSAAANICTIASGPIVFGEPMPDSTVGVAVRLLAFALVVLAAALTPPPAPTAPPQATVTEPVARV
jgi:multidrug transporter EmrE-like cation transporter